jgi:hypothetical protein
MDPYRYEQEDEEPPSRLGAAVLIAFALCIFGVFAAVVGPHWDEFDLGDPEELLVLLVGTPMVLGFVGIIGAFVWFGSRAEDADPREKLHPEQPWLRREEWARGEAVAGTAWTVWPLVGLTLWVAAVDVLLVQLAENDLRRGEPEAFLVCLPLLFGLWLARKTGIQIHRWLRFGRMRFRIDTIPATTGGSLRGVVNSNFNGAVRGDIVLRLSYTVAGHEQELPCTQIDRQRVQRGPMGTAIPIDIELPTHVPGTSGNVDWFLELREPHSNLRARFCIPVFVDRDALIEEEDWEDDDFETVPLPQRLDDLAIPIAGSEWVSCGPPGEIFGREQENGGVELRFPRLRNAKLIRTIFVLDAVLIGVSVGLSFLAREEPFVWALVGFFSLVGWLVTRIAIESTFGAARLFAGPSGLELHYGMLAVRRRKRIEPGQVKFVMSAVVGQAGPYELLSLIVTTEHGRQTRLRGTLMTDNEQAHWARDAVRIALGIQPKNEGD